MTEVPGGPGTAPAPGPGPLERVRFSGRGGGVSVGPFDSLNLGDHVGDDPVAVGENRDRLAATVGLTGADLAVMQAAHGRRSSLVTQPGTVPLVDILVTTQPGLGLVALAADCVPIALVDPVAGVAAAVHAGWRGVSEDTAGAAVAAMVAAGAQPAQIVAHLGPAICAGCYEVSPDVREEVAAVAPQGWSTTRAGTAAVALHPAVTEQLRRAGVTSITADQTCTAESTDLFSYRRDGQTGRHGVVVRLPEAQ